MTREEILNAIGPCSLLYYTCFGYKEGGICKHATHLYNLYKGWYEGHANVYGKNPTEEQAEKLKKIKNFNEALRGLMNPQCPGCRKSEGKFGGCIQGCIIPECSKNHGVEFCGECKEFPCQNNIPGNIRKAWLDGNNYIKEYGFEKYFETHKHIAHYIEYYDPSNE